jgi:hypothetical protein
MADLMPDGKRFIAVLPVEADKCDRNTHLTFLLNFSRRPEPTRFGPEINAASSRRNGGPLVAAQPNLARHSAATRSPSCNKRFARDDIDGAIVAISPPPYRHRVVGSRTIWD